MLGIIAWFVLLLLLFLLGFGLRWILAEPTGRLEAREEVQSADFRLFSYNHFFDLCASIEGYEDQAVLLEDQLAATPEDEDQERNRLRSSLSGVKGQRARAIARYNGDVEKEETRGQFKAAGLPDQLDVEEETQCRV